MKTPTDSLTFPAGWEVNATESKRDCIVLRGIEGTASGFVTVDFEQRAFRLGWDTSFSRSHGPGKRPEGLGWKQKLVDAAVKALKEVLK